GEMESRINGESEEETPVEEEPSDEVETADEPEKEDVEVEEQPISGKAISQLSESPEEAGIESIKENLNLPENQNKDDIEEVLEDLSQIESEDNQEIQDIETREEEDTDINTDTLADADPNSVFKTEEGEDWIDTVKRAIETSFGEHHLEAVEWLVAQSTNDSDQEVQIAEQAITAWVDSRSAPDRKLGAEIISRLAKTHQETYVQILQRQMLQSVREKHEDKRRQLVPLFHVMRDVDINLTEHLIRAITKDLGIIGGEDELAVIETAKLTLLQLVIQSRRLTRICVQELLVILDTRTGLGPEIWNVLTAFDAGSISIELVTNFSITKAEEIIRRSNLLRFTGSYYSTITKVIQAWKDGDKAGISATTGTILPEETLRKFDRLELARKLDKLKMVQLSTLAESLGKDVETVERLITELIVNDELKAELKLVDDKMYLVSEDAEKSGN
ncbi:MAG: hypothetical protein ACXAE3_12900, partial [Candidatus Kariarchaeaceae archaeon]